MGAKEIAMHQKQSWNWPNQWQPQFIQQSPQKKEKIARLQFQIQELQGRMQQMVQSNQLQLQPTIPTYPNQAPSQTNYQPYPQVLMPSNKK